MRFREKSEELDMQFNVMNGMYEQQRSMTSPYHTCSSLLTGTKIASSSLAAVVIAMETLSLRERPIAVIESQILCVFLPSGLRLCPLPLRPPTTQL